MRILTLLLAISLIGCSNFTNQQTYPSLEEECKLSESENSQQCVIANADDTLLGEREYSMGLIHFFVGSGEIKNCDKAKYWFEQAAEKENLKALDALGVFYFSGCNAGQDYKKAEEYYILANQKGSLQAKANLGELYREGGYGIEQDYDKALKWYQLAIKDNPYRAYNGLASLYIDQEDYDEAYKYLVEAADLDNPEAQYNLGVMYDRGVVVEQNKEQAKYWYKKAADNGWADAQYNLNILLSEQAK